MVPKSTLNNAQLEDSSFVGAHLTGARRTYTNRTIANLTGATAAITGFPGGASGALRRATTPPVTGVTDCRQPDKDAATSEASSGAMTEPATA